jgi:hypothetical protein
VRACLAVALLQGCQDAAALSIGAEEVRLFVASQLGLLWDPSEAYSWHGSTHDYHLAQIREHTGWHFPTAQDKEELENWLRNQGAKESHTADTLFDSACERLRSLRVELPAEGELERVVSAALNGFFQDVHRQIFDALAAEVCARIDTLLLVPESAAISGFEGLKADPGKAGVDNLQAEIEKLTRIRAVGVGTEPFAAVPWKVLQILKRRASKETASEMRDHSNVIRYALMACFLHERGMEVTDDITRMAIDLIHRMDTRSEKQIHREFLADLKRVDGKLQILSRVAEAVVEKPDGIVREVIFSRVKEETLQDLVAEFRASGPELRLLHQTVMQRKFARHSRRMFARTIRKPAFSQRQSLSTGNRGARCHSAQSCETAGAFFRSSANRRRRDTPLERESVRTSRRRNKDQSPLLRTVRARKAGTRVEVQRGVGPRVLRLPEPERGSPGRLER